MLALPSCRLSFNVAFWLHKFDITANLWPHKLGITARRRPRYLAFFQPHKLGATVSTRILYRHLGDVIYFYFRFRNGMDDELLLLIYCLAPRDSTKGRSKHPLPVHICEYGSRTDSFPTITGFGATSSFFGRATSGGVSIERLKLRVPVALGCTVLALAPSGSWIVLDTAPMRWVV